MNTLILMANHGKAILFSKNKDNFNLIEKWENEIAKMKDSEIFSDRFGSAETSFTSNRTALSDNHFQEDANNRFAKNIVKHLEKQIATNKSNDLIIISDKKFIGNIRNKFPEHLKKNISREILKNFYTENARDLDQFLMEH